MTCRSSFRIDKSIRKELRASHLICNLDVAAASGAASAAASAAALAFTTVFTVVATMAAAAAVVAEVPAAASVSEEQSSWTLNIISFLAFVDLLLHGRVH